MAVSCMNISCYTFTHICILSLSSTCKTCIFVQDNFEAYLPIEPWQREQTGVIVYDGYFMHDPTKNNSFMIKKKKYNLLKECIFSNTQRHTLIYLFLYQYHLSNPLKNNKWNIKTILCLKNKQTKKQIHCFH